MSNAALKYSNNLGLTPDIIYNKSMTEQGNLEVKIFIKNNLIYFLKVDWWVKNVEKMLHENKKTALFEHVLVTPKDSVILTAKTHFMGISEETNRPQFLVYF